MQTNLIPVQNFKPSEFVNYLIELLSIWYLKVKFTLKTKIYCQNWVDVLKILEFGTIWRRQQRIFSFDINWKDTISDRMVIIFFWANWMIKCVLFQCVLFSFGQLYTLIQNCISIKRNNFTWHWIDCLSIFLLYVIDIKEYW